MRLFFSLAITLPATSALAKPAALYTYQCGENKVRVFQDDKGAFTIAEAIPGENKRVLNIVSEAADLSAAQSTLELDWDENETYLKSSGLPEGSVGFMGFHYPTGQMFISAEGDTNEEGYIFAAEQTLLTGAPTVEASEIYWHSFSSSDAQASALTCTRIN